MGMAKRELERQEGLYFQALSVLEEAGAVAECELHDEVYIDQDDADAAKKAYAIGTNLFKAGNVDGTREEFMEAIKSALADAGDECGICAKHRDE